MKKLVCFVLVLAMALGMAACTKEEEKNNSNSVTLDMPTVYTWLENTVELPAMMALSEDLQRDICGIDSAKVKQSVVMISEDSLRADEIWLVEAVDADAAKVIMEKANARLAQKAAESETYSPEQYAVVQKAQLVDSGTYVALFVSPDSKALSDAYKKMLDGTFQAPAVTDPAPTDPTDPEPTDPAPTDPPEPVVDEHFFEDAAFIGDSVTLALRNYSNKYPDALPGATFLCAGSYSVNHAVNGTMSITYQGNEMAPADALAACGAKKVFILLGMNDIGLWGIDQTIRDWGTLVASIREKNPEIEIYILSGTPIYTGGEKGSLNNTNMDAYNVKLQAFAQENGCHFVDIATPLKDSTGGLKAEYCSDKYVHLTEAGCICWINTLKDYIGWEE